METKWARIGWIMLVLPIFWAFYRLEEITPWLSMVGYFLFGLAVLIWFRLMEEK